MSDLDEMQIRQSLPADTERRLARIDLLDDVDSTSNFLLAAERPAAGSWHVAIADHQSKGRGRGNKHWYSPEGGGLWMSAAYTFGAQPDKLSALTLAIGAAVATELRCLGVEHVALKWPNDLLASGRKLGGILLDSTSAGEHALTVVCGLGINLYLDDPPDFGDESALPPIDLGSVMSEPPTRQMLATSMIACLADALLRFESVGFRDFAATWSQLDWLEGRHVIVIGPDRIRSGVAHGVADTGALLVQDDDRMHEIVSGSVRTIDGEEGLV